EILIWDTQTWARVGKLKAAVSESVVAWRPGGKQILTATHSGARVLDAETGAEHFAFPGWGDDGMVGGWCQQGRRLAVIQPTGVLVLEAGTGKELLSLGPEAFEKATPHRVQWTGGGEHLFVSTALAGWLVDAGTGRRLQKLSSQKPWSGGRFLPSPD